MKNKPKTLAEAWERFNKVADQLLQNTKPVTFLTSEQLAYAERHGEFKAFVEYMRENVGAALGPFLIKLDPSMPSSTLRFGDPIVLKGTPGVTLFEASSGQMIDWDARRRVAEALLLEANRQCTPKYEYECATCGGKLRANLELNCFEHEVPSAHVPKPVCKSSNNNKTEQRPKPVVMNAQTFPCEVCGADCSVWSPAHYVAAHADGVYRDHDPVVSPRQMSCFLTPKPSTEPGIYRGEPGKPFAEKVAELDGSPVAKKPGSPGSLTPDSGVSDREIP